jgi:hypothetical protein
MVSATWPLGQQWPWGNAMTIYLAMFVFTDTHIPSLYKSTLGTNVRGFGMVTPQNQQIDAC